MKTPQGGWFGLMIRVGREAKSEEEFDEKLAKQLQAHEANGQVWGLLARYDWKSAKRAAFCSPMFRTLVERDLLGEAQSC